MITTPNGTVFESRDSETDEFNAIGKWFFAGLSDDLGPRARAEFVDRASSISVSYLHTDQASSLFRRNDDPSFPLLPPVESFNFGADGDSFAADVRYVDRDSGWFGSARWFTSSLSVAGANTLVFEGSDVDAWNLGVGKYLLETTALSLEFGQVDGPGNADSSLVAATFTHLGNVGERWQYAIDLGYGRSDAENGPDLDTWGTTFAVYPTRDVEFGVGIEDVSAEGGFAFDADATTIAGFASWFVKPNVQLSARYSRRRRQFLPQRVSGRLDHGNGRRPGLVRDRGFGAIPVARGAGRSYTPMRLSANGFGSSSGAAPVTVSASRCAEPIASAQPSGPWPALA